MARALMVLGTSSHVGKSLFAAAFCRLFRRAGFHVAPFKAQNMSLNSAATADGFEIGRAQALQAEAAGVEPTVDMNPILIKPSSDTEAQVVVRGRVWGQITAGDYHRQRVEDLFPVVVESYRRLASRHDIVVLEGAGSPAEVNLQEHDIVNLRMATAADAACLLVGDIDRGGVFASLLGTVELLAPADRSRIRGFAINKFRGDRSLLQPGIRLIEERVARPCVGVVPYLENLDLDEEDSVALEDRTVAPAGWWSEAESGPHRRLKVAVVALPHLANFTDLDSLASEPSVALRYVKRPAELERADLVILPGTKQTLDDLTWLKERGFGRALCDHVARHGLVFGICGGMQMLGRSVHDPHAMEGGGEVAGLDFLPTHTVLGREKVTVRTQAKLVEPGLFGEKIAPRAPTVAAYEIHLGVTVYEPGVKPLFRLAREGVGMEPAVDGASSADGRVIGTHLHGVFDADAFRHAFLGAARAARGLAPADAFSTFTSEREARLDRLADAVGQSLDVGQVWRWLGLEGKPPSC